MRKKRNWLSIKWDESWSGFMVRRGNKYERESFGGEGMGSSER